ncbi:MAG TPA: hypothetical protein VIA06_18105 [Candidatus Dormibacteraeota bacterium]|jgi:hypothetical protein|nr:hypothetical protein [Candidatus Dormibacteraeota bacterium]
MQGTTPTPPGPPTPYRVPARRRDDLRLPYLTLLVVGVISLGLLGLGLDNLVAATMPWEHTNLTVKVTGVYAYDKGSGTVHGPAIKTSRTGKAFAAKVDWASLPSNLSVGAAWYSSEGTLIQSVGPSTAGSLAARHRLVPMDQRAPPDTYGLLVLHYDGGKPIEILGRTHLTVTSG